MTTHARAPKAWVYHEPTQTWRHRPWWKVAINTVLRAVQPWPRKLVIYTVAEGVDPDEPERRPIAVSYGFGLVRHDRVAKVWP